MIATAPLWAKQDKTKNLRFGWSELFDVLKYDALLVALWSADKRLNAGQPDRIQKQSYCTLGSDHRDEIENTFGNHGETLQPYAAPPQQATRVGTLIIARHSIRISSNSG